MSEFYINAIVDEKCSHMRWYKASWNRFLFKFLPARTKRLVFLASIFGYIKDTKEICDDTLEKINRIMHLSRDNHSMSLPIVMKDVIWKDLKDVENEGITDFKKYILSLAENNNVEMVVQTLINKAPCWTLYGDDKTITKDVKLLLKSMA